MTRKSVAWHFMALRTNVMTWQGLKIQDRAGQKRHSSPSLDYWNEIVRKDFRLFMGYENFPIFINLSGESFYITKRDGDILFRTSTPDGVYCYSWQWDSELGELDVDVRDAGEIAIEITAFSEQLDEMMYLIAKREHLLQLSKVPAYKQNADFDIWDTTSAINSILSSKSIPKEAGNRFEGDLVYLEYKALTLRYNANDQQWFIQTQQE